MKLKAITLFLTNGTDKIDIETDLPCPYIPEGLPSQPNLRMSFDCSHGFGQEYIKNHFPNLPLEIIDIR